MVVGVRRAMAVLIVIALAAVALPAAAHKGSRVRARILSKNVTGYSIQGVLRLGRSALGTP